jgi:hypothetical protein
MRLAAGGIRELHWHAADEWALMLYSNSRLTAIDFDGSSSSRRPLVFSDGYSAFLAG